MNAAVSILKFMLAAYAHAWPYLLLTIPLAVVIKVSGLSRFIGAAFSAQPLLAVFLAAGVGAFSPFCSCGVIPVITSLLVGGVPLAPVMAFWLASPSMDPEIFFLSVSLLGRELAVWRLTATFLMSLMGGYATHILITRGWLTGPILRSSSAGAAEASRTPPAACCAVPAGPAEPSRPASSPGCSCGSADPGIPGAREEATSRGLTQGEKKKLPLKKILEESRNAVFMIVKFMTLAFFIEALIVLYLPPQWITALLGEGSHFSIPAAALISVPLYTTNMTALGLMGGLVNQGMSPAAALAFLLGGATTTLPAMAAVFGIVRPRVFAVYLASALGASLAAGFLYQILH